MFHQTLDPVAGSLTLSALCAALPLVTLFVLLGGFRTKAWVAGVASLAVSLVVAVALFTMPVGQALLAGTMGAAFALFPIMWIVVNAIWVYNLTVDTGYFDVLRGSFARVSPDHRVQAIIIAFCFGALLEALAGFGTPVAITVVMLLALGFEPIKACAVSLIANTAPVAFGALATPIVTLSEVTAGQAPGMDVDTLGAMVGRQTPVLAVIVPLVLVFVVDGRRGLRQAWLPAIVAGLVFGLAQFATANFISVPLADIVASLLSAAAVVVLMRVWSPAEHVISGEPVTAAATAEPGGSATGVATGGVATAGAPTAGGHGDHGAGTPSASGAVAAPRQDSRGELIKAYLPYIIIIALFSIANIPSVKAALETKPWYFEFTWPGLHITTASGEPLTSTTFTFNWLESAGTLLVIAGILTALVLRISPGRAIRTYGRTYHELRWAIVTVMAVLALAFVMNMSGETTTIGALLAETGALFAVLSPMLGWLGVAVSGSDTSSNALFGALQVQTATGAGLDPVLMAAANSSGGVLGKMVSPQNLAIAAAAVGMAGREGDIFRKVLGWSLFLLALMCILVALQATPILSWMVP